MATTHTGALTGHDYTIPEMTDSANIVSAFTQFSDTIREYPEVRISVYTVTGSQATEVQSVYMYEGASTITLTLPESPFDGERVVAYQLGDGEVTLAVSGADDIAGGIPVTGAKFAAVSAVYSDGLWFFLPFPL